MFEYMIRSFGMFDDLYRHDRDMASHWSFNAVKSRSTGRMRRKKRNMLTVRRRTRAKHRKAK